MLTEAPVVARYHGIEVLQSPMLSPRMTAGLNSGRYERREIACGLAAIPRGARLLELGAGAGIVAAVLTRALELEAVLSVEANPRLLPFIERLHEHNGLAARITPVHGVVLTAPDVPETIRFNVEGNFLGSSLLARPGKKSDAVTVPVLRYDALKQTFPHNAIMMDIEGGELDFLRHADLAGVEVFVAELHRDVYGREGMREVRRLLEAQGLAFDGAVSRVGVHVYRRA